MFLKQTTCQRCGGLTTVTIDGKEVDWQTALVKAYVAPDAWCICKKGEKLWDGLAKERGEGIT